MRCFESLLRAAAHSGPLPPLPNHSTSWIPVSRNVFKSAAQGSRVLAGPDWSTLAMKPGLLRWWLSQVGETVNTVTAHHYAGDIFSSPTIETLLSESSMVR